MNASERAMETEISDGALAIDLRENGNGSPAQRCVRPPRCSGRYPFGRFIVAVEAVAAFVLVRLFAIGGAGGFPMAGTPQIGPGAPHELKVYTDLGYDGQYVYRLAIDPFTTHATAHGITLDFPGYRQQRIMTALLAHGVHWVPGISIAVALILVNGAAVVVAILAGTRLAEDLGRRSGWGWLIGLPACLPASLAADLTEPVAWAAVLVAIVAARRSRWLWAAVAFTVALLARETSALVLAGFAIESLTLLIRSRGSRERARLWLLVPIMVEAAWQVRLWQVWGAFPALSGLRNTNLAGAVGAHGPNLSPTASDSIRHAFAEQAATVHSRSYIPGSGVVTSFFDGLVTGDTASPVLGASFLVERLVLVALVACAAWALVSRRSRPGAALTVGWLFATLLAVLLGGWGTDLQFLRAAMEAWGVSVVVLVASQAPKRWDKPTLLAAALVTGWMTLFYIFRT